MKSKIVTALLASAFMPLAAYAQGTTTPPASTTPPAATDSASPDAATPPAGDTATPPAGGATTPPAGGATTPDAGAADDAAADDSMDSEQPEADSAAGGATDTEEPPADAAAGSEDPAASADAGSEVEGPFVTVPPTGAWRTSDLEGKDVEDSNGENIGSISDTLVNEQGEVIAVLVGVGGFLGIGSKDVAVAMDSLEFGPTKTEGLSSAPASDAGAAAPAGGGMAPAGGAAPAGGGAAEAPAAPPVVGEDNLPDRIVLNVTREELEAAPAYGEPEDAGGDAGATGGGMAPAGGGMAPAGGGGMAPAGGGTAPQ